VRKRIKRSWKEKRMKKREWVREEGEKK